MKYQYSIDEILDILNMEIDSFDKKELVSIYTNIHTPAIRKIAVKRNSLNEGDIIKTGSSWTATNGNHKVVDFEHDGVELIFTCKELEGFKLPYKVSEISNNVSEEEKEYFIEELMWSFSYSENNEYEQEVYVSNNQMFKVINVNHNEIEVQMIDKIDNIQIKDLEPANIIESLS